MKSIIFLTWSRIQMLDVKHPMTWDIRLVHCKSIFPSVPRVLHPPILVPLSPCSYHSLYHRFSFSKVHFVLWKYSSLEQWLFWCCWIPISSLALPFHSIPYTIQTRRICSSPFGRCDLSILHCPCIVSLQLFSSMEGGRGTDLLWKRGSLVVIWFAMMTSPDESRTG